MNGPGGSPDEALAGLKRDWPSWEIWVVPLAVGGTRWCARLRADHRRLLHAGGPGELAEYLAEASGRAPGGAARPDRGDGRRRRRPT